MKNIYDISVLGKSNPSESDLIKLGLEVKLNQTKCLEIISDIKQKIANNQS